MEHPFDDPQCPSCKCRVDCPELANMGIGHGEAWGQKFNDVDMQWVSDCCGEVIQESEITECRACSESVAECDTDPLNPNCGAPYCRTFE
jgi:hypothetical protein